MVTNVRPSEASAIGGLSTGNTAKTTAIVDLTKDDGNKNVADSKEVSFNKLQGTIIVYYFSNRFNNSLIQLLVYLREKKHYFCYYFLERLVYYSSGLFLEFLIKKNYV